MKIVIDTNVIISGSFFGGIPKKILEFVINEEVESYASSEIIKEYYESKEQVGKKIKKKINDNLFSSFVKGVKIIKPISRINICRDPDDDKFIECAVDAKALYIISGDKDLLTIKNYDEVEIITAKDFCEKYLSSQTNS